MRDFYPDDMRRQNWLFDVWRRVSRAFGCSEYEGPIFESLELYKIKSGDGIVGELFSFKDRGEREFAIRPEMTPTLARMVAARAGALPRPIKWFSIPRMCRAERPQRGRLREFFQWNVDILGASDETLADAEIIAIAVESLRAVGLTAADAVVRINNRRLAVAVLAGLGIAADQNAKAFQLIDRFEKLPADEFARQWDELYGTSVTAERLRKLLTDRSLDECLALAERGAATITSDSTASATSGATAPETSGRQGGVAAEMRELFERLREFGVAEFCEFDPGVVRGIAYYTGVVFETYMRTGSLRALQGGGRYDDLCTLLGGPKLSGVGFGQGDAPLMAALEELGKLPTPTESLDVFVIDAVDGVFGELLSVVGKLRSAGLSVDFSYKRQAVGKQFKQASDRGARATVVVGTELAERGEVAVKNMANGEQQSVSLTGLAGRLSELLGGR